MVEACTEGGGAALGHRDGLRACRFAALAWLVLPSCAHGIGERAVSRTGQKLEKGQAQNAGDPRNQIAWVAAGRAVTGGVASLDAPEERERLRQAVNELVSRAVASALRTATEVPPGERTTRGEPAVSPMALAMAQAMRSGITAGIQRVILEIGGKYHGPLTPSIQGTAKLVSVAVVGSARETLTDRLPGCRGPDAVACMKQQLEATGRSAKAGFSRGIVETIGWQLLVAAVLIGLALGIVGPSLWSLRTRRRLMGPRTT